MLENYDWKKEAAAAVAATEDLDDKMERAFMSQAYDVVLTKAGALAQDPYRLGFEIVYRNDENTRMVGMFAFRVGEELLYAPVFFMNGAVTGTDMLYRDSTGTIIPLNKDWAQFLIQRGKKAGSSGQGVDRSVASSVPSGLRLDRVVYPAVKRAATEMFSVISAGLPEYFEKRASGSLLKDFLTDEGGFRALALIGDACAQSTKFAHMLSQMPEDCWAPNMAEAYQVKQAATLELSTDSCAPRAITIYAGAQSDGTLNESETNTLQTRGVVAKEEGEASCEVRTLNGNSEDFETISTDGMYKVVDAAGKERDVLVVTRTDDNSGCKILVDVNTGEKDSVDTASEGTALLGQPVGTAADLPDYSPAVGDRFISVDVEDMQSSGRVCELVGKKSTSAGITEYSRICSRRKGGGCSADVEKLTINANLDAGRVAKRAGGNKIKFIKVTSDDVLKLIDASELINSMVKSATVVKFSAFRAAGGELYLETPTGPTTTLPAEDMKIAIASTLDVPLRDASLVVDETMNSGQLDFSPIKIAGIGTEPVLSDYDTFDNSQFDDYYGAMTDPAQRRVVSVRDNTPELAAPRAGDGWDPQYADGLPKNVLLSATSQGLADIAQRTDISHVFEHGMVAGLLGDYGISAFDKYLPALEKGVDALGRLLFLFYWKPTLVQEAYGADDAEQLEQQLLHSFKNDGDLLLRLLKKSNALHVA